MQPNCYRNPLKMFKSESKQTELPINDLLSNAHDLLRTKWNLHFFLEALYKPIKMTLYNTNDQNTFELSNGSPVSHTETQ